MDSDTIKVEHVKFWKHNSADYSLKAVLEKSPFHSTGGVNVFEHGAIYTSCLGGQKVVFGDTGEVERYDFMELEVNQKVVERLGKLVISFSFDRSE